MGLRTHQQILMSPNASIDYYCARINATQCQLSDRKINTGFFLLQNESEALIGLELLLRIEQHNVAKMRNEIEKRLICEKNVFFF